MGEGDNPKLSPLGDAGSGSVQEKEKVRLEEIISKVNDLFEGELTEDDRLVYINNVIKGKLLESKILAQQTANNTKEQFANSPDLSSELMNAIMDALAAHSAMSKQAWSQRRCVADCGTFCSVRHSFMRRYGNEEKLRCNSRINNLIDRDKNACPESKYRKQNF